jgi:hypothetical protein
MRLHKTYEQFRPGDPPRNHTRGTSLSPRQPRRRDLLVCTQAQRLTLLQEPSAGLSSGVLEKQSERLGDRVSMALIKIFKGKELEDPDNIKKFLPVIRLCFLYPKLIPNRYRKPKVTLTLLMRLERRRVADAELKSEISSVARFVRSKHVLMGRTIK